MQAVVYNATAIPSGFGAVSVSEPVALDRAPWWQVIDREGWCHRQTMYLLQRLEDALFGKLPAASGELDYQDWDNL